MLNYKLLLASYFGERAKLLVPTVKNIYTSGYWESMPLNTLAANPALEWRFSLRVAKVRSQSLHGKIVAQAS